MAIVDFSVNKVQMWAVIAGVTIEVSRVELRYALNTIPECRLVCAIGREVKTLFPSTAHGVVYQLVTTVPVTVFCTAFEAANSGVSGGDWPFGPFVVFQGMVVGVNYKRSRSGSANLSIACRHFLAGLEFSWAPTKATHPRNAGWFGMQAGIKLNAGQPNFVVSTLATPYFTTANIQEDYWGNSLQPWLVDIAGQKQIFENEAVEAGNDDAIATLNLFEPFVQGGYTFGVPLRMDAFQVLGTIPGIQSIVTDATHATMQSFAGITFWEKIVQDFGGRYLFSVTPMAERALVTPVIPGLQSDPDGTGLWVEIDPDEYDTIDLVGFLPRPLRGVILQTGPNSLTGAFGMLRGQALAIKSLGGRYENPNMQKGMLQFRDAPQWLANVASQMAYAKFAAQIAAIIGNAFKGPLGMQPPIPDPVAIRGMAKTLWDAYAKALYLFEVFKTRRGTVVGKLRFDIAPGSSISVVTAEEKFLKQDGIDDQILYGVVTGVTCMIDSDATQSYTSVEVGWLQNEVEHADPALTVPQHPLWSAPFVGAPLVENFAPEPPPVVS